MIEEIRTTILTALPDATVHVASPDNTHFEALVVSASFEGQPLVRQHQVVMRSLKEAFREKVHAMQLTTLTPAQWESRRSESER